MKVLVIQNCAGEGIGLYERYLKEKGIRYSVFRAYLGRRFPNSYGYDAVIVGGTPVSANDFHKHPYLRREWHYLKRWMRSGKPYLGVDCGGQILARLLGAGVKKNPVMEIGGYDVRLTPAGRKDPMFRGFPASFPVFHWHGWTFDLPKNTLLLVEGKDCRNQAFRRGNAVALQFHLQVDPAEADRWAKRYRHELEHVHKTAGQVVEECRVRQRRMKKLAGTLLTNFFDVAGRGGR